MAKRSAQDTAAAKAKKQKIILIVGGVLLLAVAGAPGAEADEARRDGRRSGAGCRPERDGHTRSGRSHGRPRQGLRRRRGRCAAAVPRPSRSRRASLRRSRSSRSRIRSSRRSGAESAADATAPPAGQGAGSTGANTSSPPGSTGSAPAGTGTAPAAPAPIIYATIDFNSKPQQVEVKGTFPTPEPLFVVRSLTKKQAKISVAGGSFDGGQPVTLKLGKKVTLVNTATGVRYVLKLVYTGAQPEVIEGFTTAANKSAATTTKAP